MFVLIADERSLNAGKNSLGDIDNFFGELSGVTPFE
jgi:hypothetical protein